MLVTKTFRPAWLVSLTVAATSCASQPSDAGNAGTAAAPGAGSGGAGRANDGGRAGASGSAGLGGRAGSGGSRAGAGSGPVAGSSGAAGSSAGAASGCGIEVTASSLSTVIPTVGIVEWSSGLTALEDARIEYGLDTSYGLSAPVDLAARNHRTLLLGMKTSRTYHFRVVVTSGGRTCASADHELTTGARPNAIQLPRVETYDAARLDRGYLVTGRWAQGGPAFILDGDGDLVWWYGTDSDVMRARMSYDGRHMWIRNTAQVSGGTVLRVSLDGAEVERWQLPDTTHDLAVLPDGRIGLIGHADNGCDEILEFDPETEVLTSIFNATEANEATECHLNYLAYDAADDTFVYSDWRDSSFVKITRRGEIVWILNGTHSTFTGTSWTRNHGIHLLGPDHVLIFSNGDMGESSPVLELELDHQNRAVSELWRYDNGLEVAHGGDVQRLDNGNTLVTYSSSGVIEEVSPAKEVLQSLSWSIGNLVSYAEKRRSLYGGPPPKIHYATVARR